MKDRDDYWMMLLCILSASRRQIRIDQVDWLMKKDCRYAYFMRAMR